MKHHFLCRHLFFVACVISFISLQSSQALAVDKESDREKIVSAKARKFSKSGSARQSFLISGNYDTDHNSKEYHIDSRYYYRSDRQMHELYFLHDSDYANLGSSAGKRYLVKKSEQYDAVLSDKFLLSQSNNYAVFYGRANYDDLSSYYYDLRSALGLGRVFFNGKIEFDTSVGYLDIKSDGSKIFFLPSVRVDLKLTKNISFTQRGYFFVDHESVDNDLRTSLRYRISKKVSLALNHIFEQRRYSDVEDRAVVNQVRKYVSVGLVFDLN